MYTIDDIQNIANEHERNYNTLNERFPPGSDTSVEIIEGGRRGTVTTLRLYSRRMVRDAELVLKLMKIKGLTEVKSIGPFHPALPAEGSKVRILAGAEIRTTHPQHRGGKIALRNQTVTVSHAHNGYVNGDIPYGATVHWAGSGGYWNWTSIDNVEVI